MKSDVFSFGVLLLEIISGRKNYDRQLEAENQELLKLVSRLTILMFDFHRVICVHVIVFNYIYVAGTAIGRRREANGIGGCEDWYIS